MRDRGTCMFRGNGVHLFPFQHKCLSLNAPGPKTTSYGNQLSSCISASSGENPRGDTTFPFRRYGHFVAGCQIFNFDSANVAKKC
jgi:hypothetical protein